MENFEQLKLNRRPLEEMLLVDNVFEYAGLSSPSPELSRDDRLVVLVVEPRDFDLAWSALLLPRLGTDSSDTN